jgi:hypothetical protein
MMNDKNASTISSDRAAEIPAWKRDAKNYMSLLNHHPLFTHRVLLPTEPVQIFCGTVLRAVLLKQQGLCFTAKSGTGKTSAMFFAKEYLEQEIPGLVVYNHFSENYQVPSIRAFFKNFLKTVGHSQLTGETTTMRMRLVNKIVDDARRSGHGFTVLFIDEAQVISFQDFHFLKDTMNQCDKAGVGMVTVLMAQAPEFQGVRDMMVERQELHLLARFALRICPFETLNEFENIKSIFSMIDDAPYSSDFPVTWTEFFFPIAYSRGFRLAGEAELFYKTYVDACDKRGESVQFPTRQLFATIRIFMLDASGYDAPTPEIPLNRWGIAIHEAQILDALEIANQTKNQLIVTA